MAADFRPLLTSAVLGAGAVLIWQGLVGQPRTTDDERKQSQIFKAELKKETSGTVPAKSRPGDSCLEGKAKRGDMRINPETGHIELCH
jgi:hypothetical protein